MISVETDFETGREATSRGDAIIIVDVLRFSSSVVVGLSRGAKAFIPVKTLAEARSLYKKNRRLILAGERGGVKPKGFHLGNSPREFERADLDGKYVVITTTNGTMALINSKGAKWLLVGSFINARAVSNVASRLTREGGNVTIVLASRKGRIFLEDFLCAGLLASNITDELRQMSDEAIAARLAWMGAERDLKVMEKGSHATYLEGIGYGQDVAFCLQRDVYDLVPCVKGSKIVRL